MKIKLDYFGGVKFQCHIKQREKKKGLVFYSVWLVKFSDWSLDVVSLSMVNTITSVSLFMVLRLMYYKITRKTGFILLINIWDRSVIINLYVKL